MSSHRPVRVYDLGPSPNSKKVRLALGYKGIDHERVAVDPADRSTMLALSGQPLTPVLTHGDTVVFDSGAILRYLEANVKREPRLFSEDRERMHAIESWELFTRTELGPQVGALFGQYFAPEKDPAAIARANEGLDRCAARLEEALSPSGWLVGDQLTAADLSCAASLGLALLTEKQAAVHPIMTFFRENFRIAPEREALRRWYGAVDANDPANA